MLEENLQQENGHTDRQGHAALFGNPTLNSGKFYRVNFGSERNTWHHRSIDSHSLTQAEVSDLLTANSFLIMYWQKS